MISHSKPAILLEEVPKTDQHLREMMRAHYSQPKGFVGRSICYMVVCDGQLYGAIVGGSATMHLPGRNEFLDITKAELNNVINNIFYHVEKVNGHYPFRNFTVAVLREWRARVATDWEKRYGDVVIGWESLVEPPRTGDLYLRDKWAEVGITKGYTCKRTAGYGTDSWGGKRVWTSTGVLRPKRVFCKKREDYSESIGESQPLSCLNSLVTLSFATLTGSEELLPNG